MLHEAQSECKIVRAGKRCIESLASPRGKNSRQDGKAVVLPVGELGRLKKRPPGFVEPIVAVEAYRGEP